MRPRRRAGRRGILAERLRRARSQTEMTQEEAAAAIGVSRVTVARWETGTFRPRGPARRFVELWIASALGEEVTIGT